MQQLIKLYAGLVIPGILQRYLIIDADTFFLKPTTFIELNTEINEDNNSENDLMLFNYSSEYHFPYFEHMLRMHPKLIRCANNSGISHHMLFDVKYIKEMFKMIEELHNDIFYNIFLKCIDTNHYLNSGASEYELYFNYMINFHNDKIKIRKLIYKDIKELVFDESNDYVSYHWYMH